MTKLAELQSNFLRDCLSPRPHSKNLLLTKDIDTSQISASGLMGIYQNSAIANIIAAMKLTYPVIDKLVGEDFFRASCKKYILSHHPTSANMDDYGGEFAEFLAGFEPAKQLKYLNDVAQLEWLFHLSSLANDASSTDWALLSNVAPDDALQVKLLLAPPVKLISSAFPLDKIWQMNQENSVVNQEIDLSHHHGQTCLVIFRRGLKTEIMAVTVGEFALLSSCSKQQSLTKIIEAATSADNTISIDETIKKFIALTIISGFKTA